MLTFKKPAALLACLVTTVLSGNALAQGAQAPSQPVISPKLQIKKLDFTADKRIVAQEIAAQYPQLKSVLLSQLDYDNLSLDLTELAVAAELDLTSFKRFERHVVNAKGFTKETKDLVELRLADQSMLSMLKQGVTPLFAFEPKGNEKSWQYIEAFDINGNSLLLDVAEMPARPVMVVDINSRNDLKEGLKVMRAIFQQGPKQAPSTLRSEQANASAVLETTVLKQIRVNDDQEPWISGKAEMYGVVNGVDSSRVEPELDVVDMPYLDHEDTNYYPNQVVIFWERYRWAAADMIIMEADGNVNYKELAITLMDIAAAILRSIPDPTAQGYAIIPQLTSQLIKAMPDDWWTNDDDYVDVFYTILKNTTYTNHYGASGNARATLAPLNINSQ